MDRSGFCEPHFAAKARVSPLGSPSVMNMLAPLVRRMFAIAYGKNEFMLLQIKGLVWGTGQALLRSPRGRNASRDGLVKLGWIHCLQYVNFFQYNVCGLCRCEPSNHLSIFAAFLFSLLLRFIQRFAIAKSFSLARFTILALSLARLDCLRPN